jgi:hypothetical protein
MVDMAKVEYRRVDMAMLQVMPDKGCVVSPKCVDCPLEVCVEELPGKLRAAVLARYEKKPQA